MKVTNWWHSTTWINLRSMTLNQRSQTQNVTDDCRIPFIGQSGRSKRTGTEISPGDASAGGVGRERADDRQTGFLEVMETFFIRTVVVTTAPHGNSVSHWSFLTLCDLMNSSLPGSSVRGILQARTLECVAMPSSRDLPHPAIEPRPPAVQMDSLSSELPGKPTQYPLPVKTLITAKGQFYCL